MPIKEGVPLHDPCEDIPQLRVSSGPTQSILSSMDSVKLLTVYMSCAYMVPHCFPMHKCSLRCMLLATGDDEKEYQRRAAEAVRQRKAKGSEMALRHEEVRQ